MKILHLNLNKKWFDMILSGEKTEEYREMSDHWFKRLTDFFQGSPFPYHFNRFDVVVFRNGYAKNAREMAIEIKDIREGFARPEWSDNFKDRCFIIFLGDIISTNNL